MFGDRRSKTYASNNGIPTGLAVAGTVANIYLLHLDGFIETESIGRVQFLRRYIDDFLLLWAGTANDLRSLANGWHPSLRFESVWSWGCELSGRCTANFGRSEYHLVSLFNKPQNLQIYMFQLPVVTSQHL